MEERRSKIYSQAKDTAEYSGVIVGIGCSRMPTEWVAGPHRRAASAAPIRLLLWALLPLCAAAQGVNPDADSAPGRGNSEAAAAASSASPVRPKPTGADRQDLGVDWISLARASGRFLAVEQAFRLATEPGTRSGLKGPFIRNYLRSAGNLHGWADGDEFYVNYVGHPMQGSVAANLWAGNDVRYRTAEFGESPEYWKGRLRAAAFAWVYSTQFEIGAASEASIGGIQASFPQQGFVDHVVTPTLGTAWMIAEDALDRYVIRRIEDRASNRWIRMLARTGLNPTRTFANAMQGAAPWHRQTRAGVLTYRPIPSGRTNVTAIPRPVSQIADPPGAPPFELAVTFQAERLSGRGKPVACAGGGAIAGVRVAASWQLIADIGGCKMLGLGPNLSGDSLAYLAGARWVHAGGSPWTTHLQFLVGGQKLTAERLWPERKKLLQQLAAGPDALPALHDRYTDQAETNGFAIAAGAGIGYKVSRALAIRVAEFSYRHSWVGPVWGNTYCESVKVVSGLVLRMGTW